MTYTNEMVLPRNFAQHSEDEMMYLDGGGGYTATCRYMYDDYNAWGWSMRILALGTVGMISGAGYVLSGVLAAIGLGMAGSVPGSLLFDWADTAFEACDKIQGIATNNVDNWRRKVRSNTYWRAGWKLGITITRVY